MVGLKDHMTQFKVKDDMWVIFFAIILIGKRELVVLLSLSSWCLVMVVWLFLAVPWVCLQFVIVVFPDHTHLLFCRAVERFIPSKMTKTKCNDQTACKKRDIIFTFELANPRTLMSRFITSGSEHISEDIEMCLFETRFKCIYVRQR